MKKYTRHVNAEEFMAACDANGIYYDTTLYGEGWDHIKFWIGFGGVAGDALYNVVSGRAFGTVTGPGGAEINFSTDSAAHEGKPWFEAILELVYRN